MPSKRRVVVLVVLAAAAMAPPTVRLWRAQRLLRSLAAARAEPAVDEVRTRELIIPGRSRPIRARLYLPPGGHGPGLVVAHGVHHQGIDGRLAPFARGLAREGLVVLTPALDDLADYRIDPRSVGELADSVAYLSDRRDLVDDPRVGLLGFSFGGGLALLAAGEPAVRERLSHVVSIGGYHDLGRVLRFFLSGVVEWPDDTTTAQPHEYGPLVLLYRHLDQLVPAADRPRTREVVRAWLHEEFGRARALATKLVSPRARRLFAAIARHDLGCLRARLQQLLVADAAALEALSPRDKLARIRAPVYLLHGAADNVIPASETQWASLELDAHEHETLVSPLLAHSAVKHEIDVAAALELILFVSHLVS
jgi:dienelactone hydrolase